MVVPTETIVRGIGVPLETAQIADLLSRMQLQAKPVQGSEAVQVSVPPTRSDVLHACDVMEVSPAHLCLILYANPRAAKCTYLLTNRWQGECRQHRCTERTDTCP